MIANSEKIPSRPHAPGFTMAPARWVSEEVTQEQLFYRTCDGINAASRAGRGCMRRLGVTGSRETLKQAVPENDAH